VALFAHLSTPLYARLREEDRLVPNSEEMPYFPWNINIVPRGMTRDQLRDGLQWLINKLYDPRAFMKRVQALTKTLSKRGSTAGCSRKPRPVPVRPIERECAALLRKLPRLGLAESWMAIRLAALMVAHPRLARTIVGQVLAYMQFRYLIDRGGLWQPDLAGLDEPRFQPSFSSSSATIALNFVLPRSESSRKLSLNR